MIEVFRDWDQDGNGTISKMKFRSALAQLGVVAPQPVYDKLFNSFDSEGTGFIKTRELTHLLHKSSISQESHLRVVRVGGLLTGSGLHRAAAYLPRMLLTTRCILLLTRSAYLCC